MSKIIHLVCLFFICNLTLSGQQTNLLEATVDPRIELVSIIFRLAEAPEYNVENTKAYSADIENYFTPYKNHPAVEYARFLRNEYFMSHDAPMRLAIHLQIIDGQISFQENIVDNGFNEDGLHNRWTPETVKEFIEKLNEFYTDTKFVEFFASHQSFYSELTMRFKEIINLIDMTWFERFFGVEAKNAYTIVLSEVNEHGGYGPKVSYKDGTENVYAILTDYSRDSIGMPLYNFQYMPIVVHELCHSFCNPLLHQYIDGLEESGILLYNAFKDKLNNQGIGDWKSYFYEDMVRACVILYAKQSELLQPYIPMDLLQNRIMGLTWLDKTVYLLEEYEKARDQYATFKDFMPQIVQLYEHLGTNLSVLLAELPSVTSCSVETGSTINKDTKEIRITFDKAMDPEKYGFLNEESVKLNLSEIKWENEQTVILCVNLESKQEYNIPIMFLSKEENPLQNIFVLNFKTN